MEWAVPANHNIPPTTKLPSKDTVGLTSKSTKLPVFTKRYLADGLDKLQVCVEQGTCNYVDKIHKK
jgi:hypothetical protein